MSPLEVVGNILQRLWIRRLHDFFKSRVIPTAYLPIVEDDLQRCCQHVGSMRRSRRQRRQIVDADFLFRVRHLASSERTKRQTRGHDVHGREKKHGPHGQPARCESHAFHETRLVFPSRSSTLTVVTGEERSSRGSKLGSDGSPGWVEVDACDQQACCQKPSNHSLTFCHQRDRLTTLSSG